MKYLYIIQQAMVWILTIYWLYQLIVSLCSLVKLKDKPLIENKNHKFMAILPAHNEENVIGNLIESLKNQDYPKELLDIYVIADNCTDNTAKIAKEAGDRKLLKALQEYRKTGRASMAKKIAVMLRRSSHIETVHLLSEKIRQAAEKYPARDFGCEQNTYLQNLMKEAWKKKEKIESSGKSGSYSVVYKEEPFVYDCDSISFQICLMTVEKGFRDQKITLEYFK